MQAAPLPWRRATLAPERTSPPQQLFLQHTMSMANLHGEASWGWPRAPPSPTESSASTLSRSTTPTSTNPWAGSVSSNSSPTSPPKISPQTRSPQSTSRCATPVAPQPTRAVFANGRPGGMSPAPISGDSFPRMAEAIVSPSHTPNPYRERESMDTALATHLSSSAVLTPTLMATYTNQFPQLLNRQAWDLQAKRRAYQWAVLNPRTALLLLMCEDIAAWRPANFHMLGDSMLPYREGDLIGIAVNPKKVVEMQWRVMLKELPQNGQHTDYMAKEKVPLQQIAVIKPSDADMKSVDKVCWLGDHENRVYVRKKLIYGRHQQKLAILAEVQRFKRLDHPNIIRLVCSYSQDSTVAFITPAARYNLDEYLQLPLDPIQGKYLLDWINDLTQALAYLHAQDIPHKGIRPQKILVDGPRVLFSAFGIFSEQHSGSPGGIEPRTFTDHSYMYAPPEVVNRRRAGRKADVFSLGCVFLAMMTVVKGQSLSKFQDYRQAITQDASFHANLDRVNTWRKQLQNIGGNSGQRRERSMAIENTVLEKFIGPMLAVEPKERVPMRRLAPAVERWNEQRGAVRRQSFDAGEAVHAMKWAPDAPAVNAADVFYSSR